MLLSNEAKLLSMSYRLMAETSEFLERNNHTLLTEQIIRNRSVLYPAFGKEADHRGLVSVDDWCKVMDEVSKPLLDR